MIDHILGIDPGGTTGLCLLWRPEGLNPEIVLISQKVDLTSDGILDEIRDCQEWAGNRMAIAIEDFALRGMMGRRHTITAPKATMDLIGAVRTLPNVKLRVAGAVKPWATDRRLATLGHAALLKGQRHAADAARHALYSGVRDYGWPDPLVTSR